MQKRTIARLAALATVVFALALSGCSAGSTATGKSGGSAISSGRCQQNAEAGTITYLSGYQFQASASILEYVAAEALGYFDDLCLDVRLRPGSGDTAQNTKLLASGQVDIAAVAEQDVIQARANGIDITGVASYSDAGLDVLMTNPDVTDLRQLDGATVGHKGYVPASVRAMLVEAGVDWDSLTLVKEGQDPTVLPRRQNGLAALTGFVSNEPGILERAGNDVTVWQPIDSGIPSSLGAMAVDPAFAEQHPTAVEDVLRAALHAYDYCSSSTAHARRCVSFAADASGAAFDEAQNLAIWTTETEVVADNPTPGQPLGGIDLDNVGRLVDMLHEFDVIGPSVTSDRAESWFTNRYIDAVHRHGRTWPAP